MSAIAGLVLPPSRPAWMRWGGRWPSATCVPVCFVVLLGLGVLFAYHRPPARVPLLTGVLVLLAFMSRLRRLRVGDVLAFAVVRLASAVLMATVVSRWVWPGLLGRPSMLDALRALGVYEVGQLALALLLLLGLDPEVRASLRAPVGAGPAVVMARSFASVLLVGAGAWTVHYLVGGGPHLRAGYAVSFTVEARASGSPAHPVSCSNQAQNGPLAPDESAQVQLGQGRDAYGCHVRYLVDADNPGFVCLERSYGGGGSAMLACTSAVSATKPLLVMKDADTGRFFGLVGPRVRSVKILYPHGGSRLVAVRKVNEPGLREDGVAGYVTWTGRLQRPNRYRGFNASSHLIWTAGVFGDRTGRHAEGICGCPGLG